MQIETNHKQEQKQNCKSNSQFTSGEYRLDVRGMQIKTKHTQKKVIYRLLIGNSRPTTSKSNSKLTLGKHRPSETLHMKVLHLIQPCFSEENVQMLSDKGVC